MSNIIYNLSQLNQVAQFLLTEADSKLICFHGDLGTGKTTLIKALIDNLGAVDTGSSPTFGLVNEYHDNSGKLLAYHLDCYRLEDEHEALDMGIEEYLNAECWVFVEWPDRIASLLPGRRTEIDLTLINSTDRSLVLRNLYL